MKENVPTGGGSLISDVAKDPHHSFFYASTHAIATGQTELWEMILDVTGKILDVGRELREKGLIPEHVMAEGFESREMQVYVDSRIGDDPLFKEFSDLVKARFMVRI